jgi:hypothetical protein
LLGDVPRSALILQFKFAPEIEQGEFEFSSVDKLLTPYTGTLKGIEPVRLPLLRRIDGAP